MESYQVNAIIGDMQLKERMIQVAGIAQLQSEISRYKKQNKQLIEAFKQQSLRIKQLQTQNKQFRQKNAQLKETNQSLIQIYQECLNSISAQISSSANNQNIRQKTMLKLDLHSIKMNAINRQEQLLKTIAKLEKIIHDKQAERELFVQSMSVKQQALRIQVKSYNYLIQEKTEQIDKYSSCFRYLQSIIGIQSKQFNFDLAKVMLEEIIQQNKKMGLKLQEKEIHIQALKQTIRILNHQ